MLFYAHFQISKIVQWHHSENDKAHIQRIELGKDNFDAEVKYSTTYMVYTTLFLWTCEVMSNLLFNKKTDTYTAINMNT